MHVILNIVKLIKFIMNFYLFQVRKYREYSDYERRGGWREVAEGKGEIKGR